MAGLEKMQEKIKADAQARAEELLKNAEYEAEAIVKKAEAEAKEYREKRMAYAAQEAEKAHERAVSAAKLEAKKRLLAAKQEILDDCFARAKEAILQMPLSDYEDFLLAQIVSCAESGNEELILSGKDKERISLLRFVSQVNARLAQSGIGAAIRLVEETVDAEAGFLLRRGDVVINCTVDAMLAAKREELEVELASILF